MCRCKCKTPIKRLVCKENYVWNSVTCACECNKDCEIDDYLKNFTRIKSICS